ncbi:MAG: PEGA domain-containing protein [Phycisphaerae bacterium]
MFAVLALAGAAGCIERTVTINTEPSGATVFLNDQEIGQSPVKTAFTWYGDYDIIVRKSGYRTLRTNRRIRTPWYQLPGIDIVTENLIPFTIHDDRVLATFALETQHYPTDEALLEAADEMRRQAGLPGD